MCELCICVTLTIDIRAGEEKRKGEARMDVLCCDGRERTALGWAMSAVLQNRRGSKSVKGWN